MSLATYEKYADEVKDYQIDWSDALGSDTISTSTWTVPSGITLDSDSNTTTTTTAWISGGTAGTNYTLENQITSSGGHTLEAYIVVRVVSVTTLARPYATLDDVQAIVGAYFTISNTSTPSNSEVSAWINQFTARLDSALYTGQYATVPVTGTNDLLVMKNYVSNAVALRALLVGLGFGNVPDSIQTELQGFRDFEQLLRDGKVNLPDSGQPVYGGTMIPKGYGT